MKYLCKYSYYVLVGILFAVVLSAMIGEMKWELIPIIICNVFILRLMDDCFDFQKDKKNKKQVNNLKWLIVSTVILCLVYLGLNVLFYGLWGLFTLLLILYMAIQNKHEPMKVFFVSVASTFYIGAYRELNNPIIVIYLCLMVVLSTIFYIYKQRKCSKKGDKQK